MINYNDKNFTFEKPINNSNIGIGKFTYTKVNIELSYSLVKNT